MPIPSPSGKETKSDFISRCMGDDVINKEFPKNTQRYAVCQTKWKDKKSKASIVISTSTDEIIFEN